MEQTPARQEYGPELLDRLVDKDQIRDVIYRYARAVDRRDFAAVPALYHSDATDDHGNYSGPVAGFFDYLERTDLYESMHHVCANMMIDLHGDTADVETYFIFTAVLRRESADAPRTLDYLVGRFIDEFAKRDGVWRIQKRVVVRDARHRQPLNDPGDRFQVGQWHPADEVYAALRPVGRAATVDA